MNFYDAYQASDRQKGRQTTDNLTGKRQGSDRQATADIRTIRTIEDKEDKNIASQEITQEELDEGGWGFG